METSLSLLEQIRQQSNSEAWDRLVRLYTPLLQTWLRRHKVLPPEDVDDLTQEVLMTVAQELPQFEHNHQPGAFRCWLRTILVHRLKHFWRQRRDHPGAVGGSDFQTRLQQLADDSSQLSSHWDREHDRHVLQHLLSEAQTQFAPHVWQAFQLQVLEQSPPARVS